MSVLKRSRIDQVDGEIAQQHEEQRADEGADGVADAAQHGDHQDVDDRADVDGPRRDAPVEPDIEDAAQRGDEAGEAVGDHPVQIDVEAQRVHAPRIVADGLERDAEGGARDIEHRAIAQHRHRQAEIVERQGIAPVDPQQHRRLQPGEAAMAVEDRVVLPGEIEEGDPDGERDHDRIDAAGAHRDEADEQRQDDGDGDGKRNRRPPRPVQAEMGAVHPDDRDHVAGGAGDRHLREGNHAAIAARGT